MALVEFKNLPDTSTPLNAANLNNNFKYLLDMIYPVGSIYLSVNSTNPSTLFGGTWVRWGNGRVPVGVDTGQTEFNTVEKQGGEKAHTLTTSELPSHRHAGHTASDTGMVSGYPYTTDWNGSTIRSNNLGQSTFYTDYTGDNQSHNILQPYITCYMWKRTA